MSGLEETNKFLFYTDASGKQNIHVYLQDDTVWTTQKGMSEIFEIDRSVITKHLKNIFDEGELLEDSVCAKIAHTAEDGKRYNTNIYNLDAIISVGYRVNSQKATQFRIWATNILKEYLIKGFAMDDDRLKQGKTLFGKDYFDEFIEVVSKGKSLPKETFDSKKHNVKFTLSIKDELAKEGKMLSDFNQNLTKALNHKPKN